MSPAGYYEEVPSTWTEPVGEVFMRGTPDDDDRVSTPTPPALVVLIAFALLGGLVAGDLFAPTRYFLIGYYGLAPLVAAVALGPVETGAVGTVALGCAIAMAEWADGGLDPSTGLRVGVVAGCALIAVTLGKLLRRREIRLNDVTAVAEATQQAILGDGRSSIPDLELMTGYHSATSEAHVGGDFYGAIHSPFGTRLIVGDVRGKGWPPCSLPQQWSAPFAMQP